MRNCPRCGAMKINFHANGYCSDCERERYREIDAIRKQFREQADSYLERHEKRREQEDLLLRGTQEQQREDEGVFGFYFNEVFEKKFSVKARWSIK